MIRVRFDPTMLTGADRLWWNAWETRAKAARKKVLDAVNKGAVPEFNDAIWKELKEKLLTWAFHEKCAYCESRVVQATDNPAAEHYRPKRTPTTLDVATSKQSDVVMSGKAHPGYYWLAYDWRNLVPACSQCNSNGKGNAFPVAKTHVAVHDDTRDDPAALDVLEEPLLLHPYNDDPEKHLLFDGVGNVAAIDGDPRGEASIFYYRLRRGGLVTQRAEAQEFAWLKIMNKLDDESAIPLLVGAFRNGELPFARAVLDHILPKLRKVIEQREKEIELRKEKVAILKSV